MNKKPASEYLNYLLVLAGAVVAVVFFWETVKFVALFGVTLGLLVTIHEWGHFIAAKAAGVRVYEFALGFGPRLVTYMRRNGTDYTIRAFPLGGFVNPKGMQPDDPITPDGLNGRRASEKALVYLAGPVMNAILGVGILLFMGYLFGIPDESNVLVGNVERKGIAAKMPVISLDGQPAQPGYKPGLRVGDRIIDVDGKTVDDAEVVTSRINTSAGQPVTLTVLRQGHRVVLRDTPKLVKITDNRLVVTGVTAGSPLPVQVGDQIDLINGKFPGADEEGAANAAKLLREASGQPVALTLWRDGRTRMVVNGTGAPLELKSKTVDRYLGRLYFSPTLGQGPRVSLGRSFEMGWRATIETLKALGGLFSKPKQLKENVGGPIEIGAMLGQVDKLPAFHYFGLLASLSLSLAVFNLLPIPILDGGHLLVLTAEVVRRRRLEPETHRIVALVGLAIIGVLFVLITYKDIMKHFG